MQKRIRVGTLIILILILMAHHAPATVSAQERQPTDDEVNAIAKKLFCPVCENTPLDVCGTQACIDWRAEIRKLLAEGWNEDQIVQYFVDQHGAQILPEPPAEGFNLLVYILPPVIFLLGLIILLRAIRNWQQPIEDVSVGMQDEQDDYIHRMEEQLRNRQEGA